MYLITTDQLCKRYGDKMVINHVDMHIPEKSIYGFVGENGSGKTTIMRLLTGLAEPTSGSFTLFGVNNKDPKIYQVRQGLSAIVEATSLDPTLTLSFDLLMRGLEITSGGQRIHKEQDYRDKMIRRGMNPDAFRFYLDTFRNGMPPHGGFAIGLERITACFLGIANVKECSMFPRDINRVAP